jgi:hypothetical protein
MTAANWPDCRTIGQIIYARSKIEKVDEHRKQ